MSITKLHQDTKVRAGNFIISQNGSGEVFVQLGEYGPRIRITDSDTLSFIITAHGYHLSPTAVNGLDAFKVS